VAIGDTLYAVGYQDLYVFGPTAPNSSVGSPGYSLTELTEGNGTVYFVGNTFGDDAQNLFRYDPSTESIEQLTFLALGDGVSNLRDIAVTDDAVYFVADYFDGIAETDFGVLTRVDLDDETDDGSPFGTTTTFGYGAVDDAYARSLVAVGEQVYFIAVVDDGTFQEQLFRADDSGATPFIYDNSFGHTGYFGDMARGPKDLLPFNGGVLANFYDSSIGIASRLYFSDEGDFFEVDGTISVPKEGQVVDGEAFFAALTSYPYGSEQVFAYDGANLQQLSNHDAYPTIVELEVFSREQLFVTSYGSNGNELYVYEYSPGRYGYNGTYKLDRNPGNFPDPDNRLHINNLTAADSGLYFEVHDGFGGTKTMFASYDYGLDSVDAFFLSTNRDRGFDGRMPLASFWGGEGAEPTFYTDVTAEDFVDIAPGKDPDFPAGPAHSFPTNFGQFDDGDSGTIDDIYALATIPGVGPDTAGVFRIHYDEIGDSYSFAAVSGLGAVGSPLDPDAIREFLFTLYTFDDVATTVRGIYDPIANEYQAFELWLVEGLTATKIDDNAGYLFQGDAARAGNVLFYEDEVNAGVGSQVGLWNFDTDSAMTVSFVSGYRSDPREFTSAGGGVYVRAITQLFDFNNNGKVDDFQDWDVELVRVETNGTFTVLDLRPDGDASPGSYPRQLTAIDEDTIVAFGDSSTGPRLFAVTGTSVDYSIDLTTHGIWGVPFLDGGTEIFEGHLFFFADTPNGTQLFRFDLFSQEIEEVSFGAPSSQYNAFDYSMEVADGLLWVVFDQGFGDGLELYWYGDPFGGEGGNSFSSFTDLDGYEPAQLVAVAPPELVGG